MPGTPLPFGLPLPPAGWAQRTAGISLCMIVKNEERFLERCLQSAAQAVDEIVIVDTGSTDATVAIAERFGARIARCAWQDDFSHARNEALRLATKRWILQLDADEELHASSVPELCALKSVPAHLTGVLVRCANASDRDDRSGTVSHAIARIFPNHPRIRFRGRVHEFPAVDGTATTIAAVPSGIRITHYGYLDAVVAERGKFERNTRMIELAVADEPEEPYHWYNLGMTAHVGGDQQRAAQALERMWALCERHGVRVFAGNGLQMLSTIYTEHLGDPLKGLAYADACLRIAPHYANAHFAAGKAHFAMGDYARAREMFLAAAGDAAFLDRQYIVDEDACGWKAYCEIAWCYHAEGDAAQALPWIEKAAALRPELRVVGIRRAAILESLGREAEAAAAYRSLHERYGDEQSALALVNYLLRRQPEQAVPVIEGLYRSLPPETAAAMLLAAVALVQRSGMGDGEAQLRAAFELTPGAAEVAGALEALYRARGDEDAIARIRERESAVPPRQPGDFARRAQLAIGSKEYARAAELCAAGLAIAPGDAALAYTRAIALVNLGRKEEAAAQLMPVDPAQQALYVQSEYLRAVLLRELQRPEEALTALDRVLERDAVQVDALLLRAAVLDDLGRKSEAEDGFRAALPHAKRRAAIELAGFYLREGRPAEARRVAEEALA